MNYSGLLPAGTQVAHGLVLAETLILENILNAEPTGAIQAGQLVCFDVKSIEALTVDGMLDHGEDANGLNTVHYINNASEAQFAPMGIVVNDIPAGKRGQIAVRGFVSAFCDHSTNGTIGAWVPVGVPTAVPATAIMEGNQAVGALVEGDRILGMNIISATVAVPTIKEVWFDGLSVSHLPA